jgi:cytochrome c oxidase assembly protein subunit 15
MFIGGYVSASGLGLTCPKWPLCPAGLIPMNDFIIEYFHRTIAVVTASLVIATMAVTLRSSASTKGMKIASIVAFCAAMAQITLGGLVIVERLHAILVTIHLGVGLVLVSMMVIVVSGAFKPFYEERSTDFETVSKKSSD